MGERTELAVFRDEHAGLEDLCGHREHPREVAVGAVERDVGVGAAAEMALVRQAGDPCRGGPRDDAELLQRVFAGDVLERAAPADGGMDAVEGRAAEGGVAEELHQMRIGGEVGAVGMVGGEGHPPRVVYREEPLEADRPLPGMDHALLTVGDRQHAAASFEMQVVGHPGHAGSMGEMLGRGRVARHRHRVAEKNLADVERERIVGVEKLHERRHARAERALIEVAAGVTMELHVGEMGPTAGERLHRLQERPPVARQAEVRRVHVERMRQAERFDGCDEPVEEQPRRERGMLRDGRVEIVVVATAAVLPKGRASGIGHLHCPAPAGRDCIAHEPGRFAGLVAGDRGDHRRVVGREQIDALVEDRQVGQFRMGDAGRGRGDRRVEDGGVAEGRVGGAGGVDRRHGGRAAPREVRRDPAAGIHLRARHVAVKIDAAGHHDEARCIDPREALRIGGRGDDPAIFDPDVADDTIAAVRRIVDRAPGEQESCGGGHDAPSFDRAASNARRSAMIAASGPAIRITSRW